MASRYFKTLINPDGSKADVSKLDGKIVGIYFSAHWCPPCKQFTPMLIACYNQLQKEGKPFEVVFISSDKSQEEFDGYFRTHPWKAVPYTDKATIGTLGQSFKVNGIPTLIFVDPKGDVVTDQGRELVSSKGARAWPFGSRIDPFQAIEKKKQKAEDAKILLQKQAELGHKLGEEPPADAPGVMHIQINTPSGQKTRRRFLPSHTISDVMTFCRAWDLSLGNQPFVVRTNYPKKMFTDATITLQAAGFSKQENLFIQTGVSATGEKIPSRPAQHNAPPQAHAVSAAAGNPATNNSNAGAGGGGWFSSLFGGAPGDAAGGTPPATAATGGPKNCPRCTYVNAAGATDCEMCQGRL